jgi:hypothetical protein
MDDRQIRDEEVPTPWIARQLHDGSWNVYGGERGLQFVACTGHGDAAKAHARLIAAASQEAPTIDRVANKMVVRSTLEHCEIHEQRTEATS